MYCVATPLLELASDGYGFWAFVALSFQVLKCYRLLEVVKSGGTYLLLCFSASSVAIDPVLRITLLFEIFAVVSRLHPDNINRMECHSK